MGGSWENREKRDRDENDAECDRLRRRERLHDDVRETVNTRGGSKAAGSVEPLCWKREREGG